MSADLTHAACLTRTACLAGALLLGAPACATDLLAVLDTARQQDATYTAARHALAMAQQRVPQARAALLPTLSLNAGGSAQDGASSFDGAPAVQRGVRSHNWSLQLTQPLWRADRLAAWDQAQAQQRVAQAQYQLARQDLILRVVQAYFDVLVARQGAEVALNQLRAMARQLNLAQRNFEVGVSTVTDVHEARSRFELARAQRVAATSDIDQREAELEKILGSTPASLASLRPDAAMPPPEPANPGAWMAQARQDHPQVLQQQAAVAVAAHELARQRAAHGPSLDLTASRGGNFNSGSLSTPADLAVRTRSTQVGVQFSLPLYAGGGTQARVLEALAAQDKAQAEQQAASRQAAAQARQAYAGVMQGRAQVEALAAAVAASSNAVEANQIGWRIGTRINIDVLNAQQQLFTAQRDLFKARVDTLLQGLRLKAAAGSLDDADIQFVNTLLAQAQTPQAEPQTEGTKP